MSYDLGVWAGDADDPQARYASLGEGPADSSLDAFYRDLTAQFPELHEDPEASPWNAAIERSGDGAVLAIQHSRAVAVTRVVLDLARKHGLTVFNPQTGEVHRPNVLDLTMCDGSRVENPDASVIEAALGRLSAKNWYAVLERGDHYVQIGQGKFAAAPRGKYALERRDGSPDRHYRTEAGSLAEVVTAFTGFAEGDSSWVEGFEWEKVDFS
ncbi:hypothetical protein L3Q65_39320 [Amycolatopsis sp. FU40]|uniref:hypothetical protein n=1 Tax=Amycolatopsis sp. FU40 TaxID=2914159 RepID=UPI001F2829BA|nr:hypothetical protein [Amycolatopsis sp. FU40]UKD53880.1 hypothetical protein L3Q65_39320 [Amycolatopsis sp. FU40]